MGLGRFANRRDATAAQAHFLLTWAGQCAIVRMEAEALYVEARKAANWLLILDAL